jgi:glycosyltransferase involved in cell wall biosynthesis
MAVNRRAVSVIVPVRDGAVDISELLRCLEGQTLSRDRFEVIVGDDGSSDGATDGLATVDGLVRTTYGPPTNSYAARNRAAAMSRAEVLAFCDADCRPDPEWLERGLAGLGNADLVAGRIRIDVPPSRTPWTLVDMDSAKDHELAVRHGIAETANLFLQRELFERVGGFDDSLPEHGDFDLVERCVAAGATLAYFPDVRVSHPARVRAGDVIRALWKYNRWYAVRASRARQRPSAVNVRAWVPLVQTVRARRRMGRSFGPDRRWLAENGVEPSRREVALAIPIMYLVVPYVRAAAQLRGWWDGRKLRAFQGGSRLGGAPSGR